MLIGQQGIKYGLQVKVQRQAAPVQPKLSVFGDQSDGEDDVGAQVARHAASKATDSRVRTDSISGCCDDLFRPPPPCPPTHHPCHPAGHDSDRGVREPLTNHHMCVAVFLLSLIKLTMGRRVLALCQTHAKRT